MPPSPALLARGPWPADRVQAAWREDRYEPPPEIERLADQAVEELRARGSPAHDGVAGRLADWSKDGGHLWLELQPARWALRLLDDAAHSMTALCVVRDADGRWLAGRRAAWLSTWAGRWALGAGGAVDLGESPVDTLTRELDEEWRLAPDTLAVEALITLPSGLAMLVGLATVPADSQPVADEEHDEFAWWPADVERWPPEADERLRRMAAFLGPS
jgi:8-oxo-dGTP diphosphatase